MEEAITLSIQERALPEEGRWRRVAYDDGDGGKEVIISAWEFSEEYSNDRNFTYIETVTIDEQPVYVYEQDGEPERRLNPPNK